MSATPTTIDATITRLCAEAVSDRALPMELAELAAAATARAFPQFYGHVLSSGERRRVVSYFNAVVRRRVIRGRAGRIAASRAVLDSVVADMRSAGCGMQRIADELERGWRGNVPDALIEEMTLRLVS